MSEVKRYEINGTFNVPEIGQKLENPKMVMEADFDRITAERDALQQRLTAADERVRELEGLVRDAQKAFNYDSEGSCFNPGIAFVKPWSIRAIAALKPAEGRGDEPR